MRGGRIRRVARLPSSDLQEASSLSVESPGTLPVVWDGRVWRIDTRGQATPLTRRPVDPGGIDWLTGVGSLRDGGFPFTRGS